MKDILTQKLSYLNQTVLECVGISDEKVIVKKFVEATNKILEADYGYSWFREASDPDFRWLYKSKSTPYTPQQPRKNGVMAKTFNSKQPILIGDVFRAGFVRDDARENMKSVTVIPVTYKKNNYGTLVICYLLKKKFTDNDKNLARFIGNSAAQAITISRLYRSIQESKKNLEKRVKERTAELHTANQELEQDRAEDEAILTSIGDGIIAVDKNFNIILANPQAELIFQQSAGQLKGKNIFDVGKLFYENGTEVSQTERPTFLALQNGRRVESDKNKPVYFKKNDGTNVPIALTATPIILNGETVGAVQVTRDITQDREMDKAKSELISLVSHELRTPLSGINWYVEALVKEEIGKLKPEQKKYLNEVQRANHKLIDLVYDFLNVSRIELGTFNIKLSNVNIKEITEEILEELKPNIKNKKLKISKHIPLHLPQFRIDRKVIRLVLQNIITNSVKYTPSRGKISISLKLKKTSSSQNILYITVADNGAGIPKTEQGNIFTKLYRATNVKILDPNGTGLGLYIVKSFVELSGGKIWFKSREHKGTTFYIALPIEIKKETIKI